MGPLLQSRVAPSLILGMTGFIWIAGLETLMGSRIYLGAKPFKDIKTHTNVLK